MFQCSPSERLCCWLKHRCVFYHVDQIILLCLVNPEVSSSLHTQHWSVIIRDAVYKLEGIQSLLVYSHELHVRGDLWSWMWGCNIAIRDGKSRRPSLYQTKERWSRFSLKSGQFNWEMTDSVEAHGGILQELNCLADREEDMSLWNSWGNPRLSCVFTDSLNGTWPLWSAQSKSSPYLPD